MTPIFDSWIDHTAPAFEWLIAYYYDTNNLTPDRACAWIAVIVLGIPWAIVSAVLLMLGWVEKLLRGVQ